VEVAELYSTTGLIPTYATETATPLLNLAGGLHESMDLAAVLLARGADPNVVDYHGHTPFFHAAERFHKDLFYLLLGRGARATLRETAPRGDAEEAERLLRQGADLNAGDKEGNTPLRRAAANCRYALAPSSTRRRPKRQKQPRQDAAGSAELPREGACLQEATRRRAGP
jgi:ankyrin repeat protein